MAWFPINGTKPLVGGNYVLNALNYINELNESFNAEQHKCLEREQEHENQKQERQECEMSWDTILCWPRTISGTLASIPCFDELNGISYDNTREYTHSFTKFIIGIRTDVKILFQYFHLSICIHLFV